MSYYNFRPYVSVAKRREKAMRAMNQLKKKGVDIKPIVIEGRKITRTFWGIAWGKHIESFSDYENRLPRGRTYVGNGSVCHLEISKGRIQAMVFGSQLYKVEIKIDLLPQKQWQVIKKTCCGKVGSLIELLDGSLSDEVMEVVCHSEKGLFPHCSDIHLYCTCPDWAIMCKHVASVLYGVGARLDHSPKDLFELRGLDYNELVDSSQFVISDASSGSKRLDTNTIADIFNIDLPTENEPIKKSAAKSALNKTATFPKRLTGIAILKKRQKLGIIQKEFAQRLGVSPSTLSKWERSGQSKPLLNEKVMSRLKELW